MRPLLKHIRTHRSLVTGNVLDIGCGNKPYQRWFTSATNYIGLDIATERSRPDIIGLGNALPFQDDSFDTVVAFQVLEHVPDPRRWSKRSTGC